MNAKGHLFFKPKINDRPLPLNAAALSHVQSTLACASDYRVRQSRDVRWILRIRRDAFSFTQCKTLARVYLSR